MKIEKNFAAYGFEQPPSGCIPHPLLPDWPQGQIGGGAGVLPLCLG